MGIWHWDTDDYPAPEPFAKALPVEDASRIFGDASREIAAAHQRAVLELMLGSKDPDKEA